MTKGDANTQDDQWLIGSGKNLLGPDHVKVSGKNWIEPDRLKGLVRVRIPILGLPALYIKETLYGKVTLTETWIFVETLNILKVTELSTETNLDLSRLAGS